MMARSWLLACVIACLQPVLGLQTTQARCAEDDTNYLADVKAVLKNKCYSCHGGLNQESGLRVDTVELMLEGGDSGPAIEPGSPLTSLLIERIATEDIDERMPPDGEPVTPEQIERISRWIAEGAPAPKDESPQRDPTSHWAFQPLDFASFLSDQSIDEFVEHRLADSRLQLSQQADRRTLIRRLYFDMHGLPPTPAQVTAFVNDTNPDAWPELVEEVLASPRYGERWAQHWLDVVRYADTHGFEVNTPRPNAWHYRDYVIAAFNDDKPYDQFIIEQLAGDHVNEDVATGFLVAAPVLLPGQIGKDEASKRLARQDSLDEIIVGTSSTFLGLTVGCARCHDHKFDPISQADYYAFQAFFAGVDYGDREVTGPEKQQRLDQAAKLEPEIVRLRNELRKLEPLAFSGRTLIIDDEDADRTTHLAQKNGHGTNPPGVGRGHLDDPGSNDRVGNISRARYTWWDNHAGQDVFTWNPQAAGRFRIWVSWGVHGSGVHTRDARYVLDVDGDLASTIDQQEIAEADQYYFAGIGAGESEKAPLWSGLHDAGVHDLTAASRLILRGGETGTGITADVIVLQEVEHEAVSGGPQQTTTAHLRSPVNARHNIEQFAPVECRFVRFTTLATDTDSFREPCLDELEVFSSGPEARNVGAAEHGAVATSSGNYSDIGIHQLKHINDGQYGNSKSWISNQKGEGWVQLELSEVATIDRIEWGRDREGKFKDRLPIVYQIETSMNGEDWNLVAGSSDRMPYGSPADPFLVISRLAATGGDSIDEAELGSLASRLQELLVEQTHLLKPRQAYAGKFRKPDETFVLRRGDPEQPMNPIGPRFPTIIGDTQLPKDLPEGERRRALGDWIANSSNPLPARVIVNRVWQYHFGQGIVETSSDFGLNGATPSHPKLLDWLAIDFVNSGWSIKHLHRRILLSKVYRQSSQVVERAQQVDASNRLLWRFPSRRLEAEAIRDSILAVNGQLNLETGGPGFDFFATRGGTSGFPPVESFGPNELRRMIYAHKIRMEPVPVFGAFDCPDAGQAMPKRSNSTTAIQALNLFNSPFVIEQSKRFANRLEQDHPADPEAQIQKAFQLALGRMPDEQETEVCLGAARDHGLETVCRVLYNVNEFLFLP